MREPPWELPWLLLDSEDGFLSLLWAEVLRELFHGNDHDTIPVNGGVTPLEDACEKLLL